MTNVNKNTIVEAVRRRIDVVGSQNTVARQLGISAAHLKSIREGDLDKVADKTLNKIARMLNVQERWQQAETRNYTRVMNLCKHTQSLGLSRAISFAPGTGKTYALRAYADVTTNAFYIECEEYWSKKVFLRELRRAIGLDDAPMGIAEMVEGIMDELKKIDHALVIIDEADKLKDSVLNLFKTLYNKTSAGFVLAGTPHFRHRVEKGVRLNKMGFAEIHSRIGGNFIRLYPISDDDVRLICQSNGVDDPSAVEHIIDTVQRDFRQIRASIEEYNLARKKKVS
jgi:DNA transposition AAA+ family ATPase